MRPGGGYKFRGLGKRELRELAGAGEECESSVGVLEKAQHVVQDSNFETWNLSATDVAVF